MWTRIVLHVRVSPSEMNERLRPVLVLQVYWAKNRWNLHLLAHADDPHSCAYAPPHACSSADIESHL